MGKDIYESQYPSDQTLEPGTYRISNLRAGTAIQISDHDPTSIVTWEQHGGENQQWFLQRSGYGYQLRNRHHNAYLAVSNTDNHGPVYAGRYPTTWVFLKFEGNYIVQLADRNRVLDLHEGSARNGNLIHIWNLDGTNMTHRIWKLERLGDDLGGGAASTRGERINKELAESQEEVASKDKELSQLQDELSNTKEELSGLHALLYQRDEAIRQLQQDLKLKEEALSHAYKTNEEFTHLRNQLGLLESKLSHQQAETANLQAETANLQAKMDRFEYLMSQVMSKSGGNIYTQGTN